MTLDSQLAAVGGRLFEIAEEEYTKAAVLEAAQLMRHGANLLEKLALELEE